MNSKEMIDVFNNHNESYLQQLLTSAERCRQQCIGREVYPRGLIEFSNLCNCDCFYCGLRKSNLNLSRYKLSREEIIAQAKIAFECGYHSIALQSGEVSSDKQVDFLADLIAHIKSIGGANGSLGITLSVGELSYDQYLRLWEAGAHRYLLRIESSDPDLFRAIHPPCQNFQKRLDCLDALKNIGYQVGTGVMIGLPGQTYDHLVNDLIFFKARDIDMLGMGPYISNPDTPLARSRAQVMADSYIAAIKMMALARLTMPYINMVASTAMQTIHPDGLKMGLKAGANVIMPILTPEENRSKYALYTNKNYKSIDKIKAEIEEAGYQLAFWKWGDSAHFQRRRGID